MKVSSSIVITIIWLFCFSCKKEEQSLLPFQAYYLGKDVRINDIHVLTDSVWIACGGIRGKEGYIFRTEDAGANWSIFSTNNNRSVYCVEFRDSLHGFAGGDFLDLWQTTDGGKSWQFYWLGSQVPLNEEDRPAIRDFKFVSDSLWYFCGGENLYKGALYCTSNAGATWQFQFLENEFRALEFDSEANGIVAGHGAIRTVKNEDFDSRPSDFKDDFITGTTLLNDQSILGVSYSGKTFRSKNMGETWEIIEKQANRHFNQIQWNDIASLERRIVMVGNYGVLNISDDSGLSWSQYSLSRDTHLLKSQVVGTSVFITSNDGRIFIY